MEEEFRKFIVVALFEEEEELLSQQIIRVVFKGLPGVEFGPLSCRFIGHPSVELPFGQSL